jgi:1,4-alpha-glucan branching enzyme
MRIRILADTAPLDKLMRMNFTYPFLITILFLLSGCAPKSLAPQTTQEGVRISFSAPAAKKVSIAGSFNHWSLDHDRLAGPDQKGIWTILLPLPPGRYEYRFVVNGKSWVLDPSVPSIDDGLGDRNSFFVVEP